VGWADVPAHLKQKGAGLSPAARAGLMFQPETKRGWTQPNRVGCDVPAHQRREETPDWLLCVSTVTS